MGLEDTLSEAFETYDEAHAALASTAIRDHPRRTYETWISDSQDNIKKAVFDQVVSSWTDLDSLKANIDEVFTQFPRLTKFYEDHMTEILEEARNRYFITYSHQLDLVVQNRKTLHHKVIPGIEKMYAMARSAVEEIDKNDPEKGEFVTMLTIDGQRVRDDVFVYDVFFKRMLGYLKQEDLPNLKDVPKLDLASNTFEDSYLIIRGNLEKYAEKAGLKEDDTKELNGIFETYESAIKDAREDEETMKIIKGKKEKLYGRMKGLIDHMIKFPNVKIFKRCNAVYGEVKQQYFNHVSKYSRALETNINDVNMDLKLLSDKLDKNPSTNFLIFYLYRTQNLS